MRKQQVMFHGGRTNIVDKESSIWSSFMADKLKAKSEAKMQKMGNS